MAGLISLRDFLMDLLEDNRIFFEALEDEFPDKGAVNLFCVVAACVGVSREKLKALKPVIDRELQSGRWGKEYGGGQRSSESLDKLLYSNDAASFERLFASKSKSLEEILPKNPTRIVSPQKSYVKLTLDWICVLFRALGGLNNQLFWPPQPLVRSSLSYAVAGIVEKLKIYGGEFARIVHRYSWRGIDPENIGDEGLARIQNILTEAIGEPVTFKVGYRKGTGKMPLELIPEPIDAFEKLEASFIRNGEKLYEQFKSARPRSVKQKKSLVKSKTI